MKYNKFSMTFFPLISELEFTHRIKMSCLLWLIDCFSASHFYFPLTEILLKMVSGINGILLFYQRKAISFSTSERIQCKIEPA